MSDLDDDDLDSDEIARFTLQFAGMVALGDLLIESLLAVPDGGPEAAREYVHALGMVGDGEWPGVAGYLLGRILAMDRQIKALEAR
jgi:hypothetical protein